MNKIMKYLKNEKYYIDLYDLFTIKDCLKVINFWRNIYKKKDTDPKLKKIPLKDIKKGLNHYLHRELMIKKGEEYRRKTETISEWIERDRIKEDKIDNTPPPSNNHCPKCKTEMKLGEFKHLEDWYDNKPIRVLFTFECQKCKKRLSIYENGEEYVSKPDLCPKCNKKIKTIYKEKNEVTTTTQKCTSCNYKYIEVYDWKQRKIKREAEKKKDKKLLEKYRKEFCLSEKEGLEYIDLMESMKVANVVHDEEVKKYDNAIYARSMQLKKTTVSDLEKLLVRSLKEEKYSNLSFKKPEIGKHVIVPFNTQDLDSSRRDKISVSGLEKVIRKTLKDTNWRLLSDSIIYRLGYLGGRLKGYERKEDMLKLAGKKKDVKPKAKISDKLRQKYASNNLVQLSKLMGRMKGIENLRKKRLKNEPDGFLLESSEDQYSCSICGEGHYGDEIWWNLDGQRCIDCRQNIIENKIKASGHRYDDKCNWFTDWQVKSNYGVHPATREKLKRESVLKGIDFKNQLGQIYFTMYMKDQNKEFLKKYPKKKSEIEMTITDNKGNKINL